MGLLDEKAKSLAEIHSTVKVKSSGSLLRRLLTFSGPAFMVSVGYMDPGNWATDLAGGSQFGYKLIWVILLANLMAILFQSLSARLGIVYGRDLAQACRDSYPKVINYILWVICEIAIAACDLAEVMGSALGLYLLFGIPIMWGVIITAFDVLVLMLLLSFGIRKMEAFILALVSTIGVCFAFEIFIAQPSLIEISKGFIPTALNGNALFIAIGIIGATVMPHNLYLHSALVQSRNVERTQKGLKQANHFNLIDSIVALNAAFFVNAAILVLAASAFFLTGHSNVASIIDAHSLLAPLLGSHFAPIAFGIALLAAGQSSTLTGTFAGQIVMEGFVGLKIRPWLRRLITRLLAIIPAVIVMKISGEKSIDSLLVLSQVILSLQLPFALVPLLHFTSSKIKMKEFATRNPVKVLAWSAAGIIIFLNLKLVIDFITEIISLPGFGGDLIRFIVVPLISLLILLLLWIIIEPYTKYEKLGKFEKIFRRKTMEVKGSSKEEITYKKVGIALEGILTKDEKIVNGALHFLNNSPVEIFLINCVETVTARFMGDMVADSKTIEMEKYLTSFSNQLKTLNIKAHIKVSGGEPDDEIAKICKTENIELLIVGSHGHKLIKDIIYGSVGNEVRHRIRIPILAIPVE